MDTNVLHSLCTSAFVPWIVRKRSSLQVSLALEISIHCKTPFIVVRKTPYFICYAASYMMAAQWWSFSWCSMLCSNSCSCCRALVTSASHCCVYAACSSFTRYNIHFAFIILTQCLQSRYWSPNITLKEPVPAPRNNASQHVLGGATVTDSACWWWWQSLLLCFFVVFFYLFLSFYTSII